MHRLLNQPHPGHPLCLQAETRIYRTSADRRRALTQLRRWHPNTPRVHTTDYLDTAGLAIQISRWLHGPFNPFPQPRSK